MEEPKAAFPWRSSFFDKGWMVRDISKGHPCRRALHVLTSRQPSHFGQVVSAVTALPTSASPVLQIETKYSAKSYQHPDGVRSSCDGPRNTYLSHKDLISWLNSAGWRVLISSNTLCCCFSILCPHFSYFWCYHLDQLQLVWNLWIKDTSSGRWVSNIWPKLWFCPKYFYNWVGFVFTHLSHKKLENEALPKALKRENIFQD